MLKSCADSIVNRSAVDQHVRHQQELKYMTNTQYLRGRIYEQAGLDPDGEIPVRGKAPALDELRRTQWSERFEQAARCRMIIGGLRYGLLHGKHKRQYDRIGAAIFRLQEYLRTGNDELLVDVSNFCMIEFEEGNHPMKHFRSIDDGQHVQTINL